VAGSLVEERNIAMGDSVPPGNSPADAAILRKVRWGILPFLFALYIVSYLDRINIGFAALTMNRELGLASQQFGLLAGIFFLGYFAFEIPSNLILHRVGARLWMARILISWGVVASLTALARGADSLYLFRFLLGVAEAGFFPGAILYLTYWFRRREQAQAVALFMTAVAVSSVIGAPISGLILDKVHWLGLSSWRWLLALEGLPALAGGVLAYWLLPNGPADAKFLSPEEKARLLENLAADSKARETDVRLSPRQALASGRVWVLVTVYFAVIIGFYSLGFWLPQIVKSFSQARSNTRIGLLVMLPYMAGLISMLLVSRSSDRRIERRWHASIPLLIGAPAMMFAARAGSAWLALLLISVATAGIYSFFGPFWSLPGEFLTGYGAAAGIALVNSIGNLGGFVGPYVLGVFDRKTGSVAGGLIFAGICMIVAAILLILLPKPANASARNPAETASPPEPAAGAE
jgi:ACS family tartrate transporter-like MFS transporter